MTKSDIPASSPVVVVGAGPSGLATAAMLRRARVPVVVVERSGRIGDGWRAHYDHLRLHTPRRLSSLPGFPVPRSAGTWVTRDDWAAYLEQYAVHHRLDVRTRTQVERVTLGRRRSVAGSTAVEWLVRTGHGDLTARAVVLATGRNHTPHVPHWPGVGSFTGRLLHSKDYRDPASCEGRRVLVVGAGNSGTEIAVALSRAGAARVWLSVRAAPNIVPMNSSRWQAAGIWARRLPPAWGDSATRLIRRLFLPDLSAHGLPLPEEGLYARSARDETSPVHDRGIVAAVLDGRVRPVAETTRFRGALVHLADGTALAPDVVIAATGYRTGLEDLIDAGDMLGTAGRPPVTGARACPDAPGLYFAGFGNPLHGALYQAGVDARQIARAISRAGTQLGSPFPRPRSRKAMQRT
ncbi:NAD(P)/FAD-dependent oxidoreductase [Streptomyces sp. DH12]|uniref:flavin-containing monooxygenase n=1 Tax=Streptomyces sp. DH12 TaxID=2857010 RepID=UPI001E4D22DB|nr:NAD(P)/FAD-dependent oxidoreductase [Streptomyces sp. DH12]